MSGEHRYEGSCMCGSVRFSFSGTPLFVADCVCESCRRAHGASAVCWAGVKTAQFRLEDSPAEKTQLKWYRSSEASERGFCSACGTRVLFRSEKWPGEIHMAVAFMETPHDLVATRVDFREELPAWTAMQPKQSD
mmetsp:Transcript_36971/g.80950  ORF Transcript_36971/g.80950 Transcript_36971/m.80950 type:complete len:135 (+) Transcript_36971:288-692(+)